MTVSPTASPACQHRVSPAEQRCDPSQRAEIDRVALRRLRPQDSANSEDDGRQRRSERSCEYEHREEEMRGGGRIVEEWTGETEHRGAETRNRQQKSRNLESRMISWQEGEQRRG